MDKVERLKHGEHCHFDRAEQLHWKMEKETSHEFGLEESIWFHSHYATDQLLSANGMKGTGHGAWG